MPAGRPTKMTPETIQKLEAAFMLGCSDGEACFAAGICKQTLYNYQTENPEFVDRKEQLKENPIYLARQSVISGMQDDPKLALSFLERKKKDEFSLRSEVTGKDGGPVEAHTLDVSKLTTEELLAIKKAKGD